MLQPLNLVAGIILFVNFSLLLGIDILSKMCFENILAIIMEKEFAIFILLDITGDGRYF